LIFLHAVSKEEHRMTLQRKCPTTEETFTPKNPDHFFNSSDAFYKFIDSIDDGKDFVSEKRQINWSPRERIDPQSGEKFKTKHPARIYKTEQKEEKKTKSPNDYFKPTPTDCGKCGKKFMREIPPMKYCCECSDKGGKLIK